MGLQVCALKKSPVILDINYYPLISKLKSVILIFSYG